MSKGTMTRALVAAVALGLASDAAAAAGNGIRLGGSEGRLHPFLEVEGRYDSNVLFETSGEAVDDFILHVRPGVTLDVPGDTELTLRGVLDWAQYLGVSGDIVVGALAKFIMPGDDPGGIIVTILIGIAGAFLGGFLGSAMGIGSVTGFNMMSILLAIGGSIILLVVYRLVKGRSRTM